MKILDVVFVHRLRSPELIRWHSRVHHHGAGEFELHYFLGGEGHFLDGSTRHIIAPGALYVTPPLRTHAVRPGGIDRAISYYAVLFRPDGDGSPRRAGRPPADGYTAGDHTGNNTERATPGRVVTAGIAETVPAGHAHPTVAGLPSDRPPDAGAMPRSSDAPADRSDGLSTELLRAIENRAIPLTIGPRERLLFEQLTARFGESAGARRRAADHLLASFLWDVVADMDDAGDRAATPTDGKSGRTADFNYHIARAVELFEKHRFSGIAISEVAERLEISQAHLTRVFTTHLGVPPGRYFQRLRMESAASMLLNTNKSVKEIAWEFGYPNQVHFTRTFASVAGIAPREFRTRYYRESPTNYAAKVIPDARPSGDYPTQ